MSLYGRIRNVFTKNTDIENKNLKDENKSLRWTVKELGIDIRVLNGRVYIQQQELFNRDQKIKKLTMDEH